MNLLADVVIPGHHFGQVSDPVPGSDAFVLVTLSLLAFLFGAFTAAAVVLWRRENRPSPHRRLLMELEEQGSKLPPPPEPMTKSGEDDASPRSWERRADWWKK